MSRMETKEGAHVFYTFLKFRDSILADEKDKKKFLDFALGSRKEERISVMAFSILDAEAHFLLQGRGTQETKEAASKMLKNCKNFLKEEGLSLREAEISCREIKGKKEVQQLCRYIHRTPLESGCVKQMRDYWWSSYQTYRGGYQWPGLDERSLLSYFSDDPLKSRTTFLRYHRRED